MRVKFTFDLPGGKLELPVNYNYLLQSMIYNSVSEKLSGFLHCRGYDYGKRFFKMFVFSRLSGNYRLYRRQDGNAVIVFSPVMSFYLSSPVEQILQEFANRMISGAALRMGGSEVSISSVEVLKSPPFLGETALIKMLSPITARRTFAVGEEEDGDWSKRELGREEKTRYFSPLDVEFSPLVRRNLLKKYAAFYGREAEETALELKPILFSERHNFHLVNYKGFIVKGYSGVYEARGAGELLRFAWDCGLGERNSQGFGMFDVWNAPVGFAPAGIDAVGCRRSPRRDRD